MTSSFPCFCLLSRTRRNLSGLFAKHDSNLLAYLIGFTDSSTGITTILNFIRPNASQRLFSFRVQPWDVRHVQHTTLPVGLHVVGLAASPDVVSTYRGLDRLDCGAFCRDLFGSACSSFLPRGLPDGSLQPSPHSSGPDDVSGGTLGVLAVGTGRMLDWCGFRLPTTASSDSSSSALPPSSPATPSRDNPFEGQPILPDGIGRIVRVPSLDDSRFRFVTFRCSIRRFALEEISFLLTNTKKRHAWQVGSRVLSSSSDSSSVSEMTVRDLISVPGVELTKFRGLVVVDVRLLFSHEGLYNDNDNDDDDSDDDEVEEEEEGEVLEEADIACIEDSDKKGRGGEEEDFVVDLDEFSIPYPFSSNVVGRFRGTDFHFEASCVCLLRENALMIPKRLEESLRRQLFTTFVPIHPSESIRSPSASQRVTPSTSAENLDEMGLGLGSSRIDSSPAVFSLTTPTPSAIGSVRFSSFVPFDGYPHPVLTVTVFESSRDDHLVMEEASSRSLEGHREVEHRRMFLSTFFPVFRIGASLRWSFARRIRENRLRQLDPSGEWESFEGKLISVHALVAEFERHRRPSSGSSGSLRPQSIGRDEVSVMLVKGAYAYFHYDSSDRGWGCAYRSCQTILSWFVLQGFVTSSSNPRGFGGGIPSIRRLQSLLVEIGDKDATFVGSRSWIGTTEVSLVLDELVDVQCKFVRLASPENLGHMASMAWKHFSTGQAPVCIAAGVLAWTLVGVRWPRKHPLEVEWLVVNPHYVGQDTVKDVADKVGWISWRELLDFSGRAGHYTFLFPQTPRTNV